MAGDKYDFNTRISEEAAEWFVDFRSGDVDLSGRRGFGEWLRASPGHVRAYLQIAAIWNEAPALDLNREYEVDELIQLAAADSNVTPLVPRAMPAKASASNIRGGRILRGAFAAVLALVVAGVLAWLQFRPEVISTGVGEQRSLVLSDASTVQLNSRSRIQVRYSEGQRLIDLIEGQALFEVTKDAHRPFLVRAGSTTVRAVGTRFDVYRRSGGTTITVLEGRVAVEFPATGGGGPPSDKGPDIAPIGSPESTLLLAAGEQLQWRPDTSAKPVLADLSAATAWTQRRIVFSSATLAEVAEEFNRYNTRQILIVDPESMDFHISGVFSSTDPTALIQFLRERPGVTVVEVGDQIRVSRR